MSPDVIRVVQTVLSDNQSNPSTALIDLAHRYVALSRSVCPGFSRWGMNIQQRELKPDAPAVCDDEWIKTALGDA
jgi:hypothetical protein